MIQVRAWDKKNKKMFYAGSVSGVGDFYSVFMKTCKDPYERFQIDFEWMLGSGLMSKNNKDIFAEDIIRENEYFEADYRVVYDEKQAMFRGIKINDRDGNWLSLDQLAQTGIVVGNTYEGVREDYK